MTKEVVSGVAKEMCLTACGNLAYHPNGKFPMNVKNKGSEATAEWIQFQILLRNDCDSSDRAR
jgi:hypothetical protein